MSKASSVEAIRKLNTLEGNRAPVTQGMSKARVTITGVEEQAGFLRVSWADGHRSLFHYIWLRHNCFCPACGTSADGIRSISIPAIPPDIAPSGFSLAENGDLHVTWRDDGHHSIFGPEWLRAYCYSNHERARRLSFKPRLWRSDLISDFPTVTYAEVRADDEVRLHMYELLRDYGIVKVLDVGRDADETEHFAKLLGPIHETTGYGYIFDLKARTISRAGGMTAIHQDPHTDDAFYYSSPGITVFHCLLNTTVGGGESVYVDGFAIADALREEEPSAFELLTTVPIQHNRRHPGEIDQRSHAPLIRLDSNGNLSGIRYFDRATAPLDVPTNQMASMYEALRQYAIRMTSAEFKVEFLLDSGVGIFIDNQRVMHGRNAFSAHTGRRLRLCIVDREEFHGRLRDLGSRFGRDDYDIVLPAGNTPA